MSTDSLFSTKYGHHKVKGTMACTSNLFAAMMMEMVTVIMMMMVVVVNTFLCGLHKPVLPEPFDSNNYNKKILTGRVCYIRLYEELSPFWTAA